ncbi:MAG: ThiF family adenylyltransferase, partial [Dehalococcoidales bacterium]|nr:ThiF family adenylyltransferase [Dehalococcoidales bacterium]
MKLTYVVTPEFLNRDRRILIVGCGGTGGGVAEGLCRLLRGSDIELVLIDHDRVEPHNLLRQNFYPGEVGKFKSQALAERLSRQFGRPIRYSVHPYNRRLSELEMGRGMSSLLSADLIIGCVDNAPARREIAHHLGQHTWWLDAGNGYSS